MLVFDHLRSLSIYFYLIVFPLNVELGFLNGNALIIAGLLRYGGAFMVVKGELLLLFQNGTELFPEGTSKEKLFFCSRKRNHLKRWVWKTLLCITSTNVSCIYCFVTVLVTSLFWYWECACVCVYIYCSF